MGVCMCVFQITPQVPSLRTLSIPFETGSLTALKLISQLKLSVWQFTKICLSLPPQHWDYKHMSPPHLDFTCGFQGSNSGPLTEPFSPIPEEKI